MAARTTDRTAGRGAGRVTVLAPSPELRVLVEPAPDGTTEIHLHTGGQGAWVGRMARTLGADVELCLPLGGESGVALRALLEAEGLRLSVVDIGADTTTVVLDHRGERDETDAESGDRVADAPSALTRHEVDDLVTAVLTSALAGDVVVLAGSQPADLLPADVYERLARDLRAQGLVVVADLSGAQLDAALAGGVDVLKVAHDELPGEEVAPDDVDALRAAARALQERGARSVVVTCSSEPGLLVTEDGAAHRLRAPDVTPAQKRGSGDALCGAVAARLAQGADLLDAVRTATAAGVVSVARQGHGTGDRAAVEAFAERVEVEALG